MKTSIRVSGSVTVTCPTLEPLALVWDAVWVDDDEGEPLSQDVHAVLRIGSEDRPGYPIPDGKACRFFNHVIDTYPVWHDVDSEGVEYRAELGALTVQNLPRQGQAEEMVKVTLGERSTAVPVRALQRWLGSVTETLYKLELSPVPSRRKRR
jgi:hypothetical protein